MKIVKTMELKLSCYRCGSTEFKITKQPCYNIEGSSYLLHEDVEGTKVICNSCGLKDNINNLVIKYEVGEKLEE